MPPKVSLLTGSHALRVTEQPLSTSVTPDDVTMEERTKMLVLLDYLSDNHKLGYNRLMRHLRERSDLKTIFKQRKRISSTFLHSIAAALGVSLDELYMVPTGSPELLDKVLAAMATHDLVEMRKRNIASFRRPQAAKG